MTRLLRHRTTGIYTSYPRPDDGPVLGLDRNTYQVVELEQQPAPDYDPTTHRLEPTEALAWLPDAPDPTGLDGILTRGWELIELPPPPPPPPLSDWTTFKTGLLMSPDVAEIMALARNNGCEPGVTALPLALDKAQSGSLTEFKACWQLVAQAGMATPEQLGKLAALATACNLPPEFIAAMAEGLGFA
jgi:hypothetical protein